MKFATAYNIQTLNFDFYYIDEVFNNNLKSVYALMKYYWIAGINVEILSNHIYLLLNTICCLTVFPIFKVFNAYYDVLYNLNSGRSGG